MAAEQLSAAVGELAVLAVDEFSVDDLLRRLCQVAAEALTADGVGVMKAVTADSRFIHASAPSYVELGRLQEGLQHGPCTDAMETGGIITAGSPAEMVWPSFARVADQVGVRAVISVPLMSRGRSWGSLDLYWRTDHRPPAHDLASATLLANVAVSYLVMAADRSESRKAQEQLARRVLHDQLTDLPNRGLMQELIYHALASSQRRGTSVAVLFVDLDKFKSINDTFSHQVGDHVLRTVAQRMQAVVREGDTVGRLSGDEFLVLCQDISNTGQANAELVALGERIRNAIGEPIAIDQTSVSVSASIGAALTGEQPSAAELIHLADTAMYEAKAAGRNRVVVYQHRPHAATDRRNMEQRLFQAITGEQLLLHYQPIVAADGRIAAVEALVRWEHPELGLIPAADFVDLAYSTGIIVAIGHWVIQSAVRQLSQWRQELPEVAPDVIFINLSPRELISADLPDVMQAALRAHHLEPKHIGIEILETNLTDARLVDILTLLQRRGHPLAIDDFGIGYSSLSRLIDLPVNYVKIDRTLTAKLPDDPRSRAIIKAVLALAADLNLQVISEGIENQRQADYLSAAGSHLLQGYHYASPMTADDFRQRMTSPA